MIIIIITDICSVNIISRININKFQKYVALLHLIFFNFSLLNNIQARVLIEDLDIEKSFKRIDKKLLSLVINKKNSPKMVTS